MKKLLICLMITMLSACYFSKPTLLGKDIRLWKDTSVWSLAKAVQANDTNKINKILAKGELSIDYREPKFGQSLLHWAIWNNKVDMVHFLLTKGANPNLHDYYNGESPMVLSCKYFETDAKILELLLRYGGNPNDHVTDNDSVTYEHSLKTPLTAAAVNNLAKVRLLVEAGANVEIAMKDGETPLYWAALRNRFDIIKYLFENGADYRKVYSIISNGDTLRFANILATFPYQDTKENKENLRWIREFIEKDRNK